MMSNEEWDRKAEFLLNQQAKFDADMEEMKAREKAAEKRLDRLEEWLSSQATIMFENAKITDSQIRELKATQKVTERLLQKLITRFDRHLTEGQPGLEN
jgi:hypothetical protein